MSELTVRRANAGDLPKIVELRLALLAEYADNPLYAHLHPDAEPRAWELYRTQVASPIEAIFVAERDGRIIGVLRCVDSPSSPLLLPERYCYVSSVYVAPAHRRSGVLREMLGRAVEWCLERGLDEMRLHNAADSTMASGAWQALGFDVVEQVRRRQLTIAAPRRSPPPLVRLEAH